MSAISGGLLGLREIYLSEVRLTSGHDASPSLASIEKGEIKCFRNLLCALRSTIPHQWSSCAFGFITISIRRKALRNFGRREDCKISTIA